MADCTSFITKAFILVTLILITGPAVTFALDLSPLRILPLTGFIRAPNGSLSAVLVLDQPAENTVDITCSLDVVLPSDVLRNTQGNCSQSATDKVILANNSVEIQLNAKEIQFQVRLYVSQFFSSSQFSKGC